MGGVMGWFWSGSSTVAGPEGRRIRVQSELAGARPALVPFSCVWRGSRVILVCVFCASWRLLLDWEFMAWLASFFLENMGSMPIWPRNGR